MPRYSSPHLHKSSISVQRTMMLVLLALIPGLAVQTYSFGIGTCIQILLCLAGVSLTEAITQRLRNRSFSAVILDGSGAVSAVLLGLALPPELPWYLTLIGAGFAAFFGKQLYGGLGQNPFNPAMLAYAFLLISFPEQMTHWQAVTDSTRSISSSLSDIFTGQSPDALSGATPLDVLRTEDGLTLVERYAAYSGYDHNGAPGWAWVNLAYLAGGFFLIVCRVISWHIPLAMLAGLAGSAMLFMDGMGSNSNGTPMYHLLSGATMLGAFFIATDPVSAATSNRGKVVFGLGIGMLVYLLRTNSSYPDGVAFAVLLMNLCVPVIDAYTRPRTAGHPVAIKGLASMRERTKDE